MATQYGCLREFWLDIDSIKVYLEHASLYFQVNDIDESKQVPILLSLIGASNYALLLDLVALDVPGTFSFAQIAEEMSSHFELKCFVIAECFHFHRHTQCAHAVRKTIQEAHTGSDCRWRAKLIWSELAKLHNCWQVKGVRSKSHPAPALHTLMHRYEELFSEGLGTVKPYKPPYRCSWELSLDFSSPAQYPLLSRMP